MNISRCIIIRVLSLINIGIGLKSPPSVRLQRFYLFTLNLMVNIHLCDLQFHNSLLRYSSTGSRIVLHRQRQAQSIL